MCNIKDLFSGINTLLNKKEAKSMPDLIFDDGSEQEQEEVS